MNEKKNLTDRNNTYMYAHGSKLADKHLSRKLQIANTSVQYRSTCLQIQVGDFRLYTVQYSAADPPMGQLNK
jgi:hypothetical protein